MVYPVLSRGARWFDNVAEPPALELLGATPFDNGVVELSYRASGH
jgi:hypothetical protein